MQNSIVMALRLLIAVGAKQMVPYHKDTTIIFVKYLNLPRVVHTMVAGRIKNAVKSAEFANSFRMRPKLKYEAELMHHSNHKRMKSNDDEGNIPNIAVGNLKPALPQSYCKTQMLGGMMVHMARPKQSYFVT